jgi:lipid-binding SYLF domain-containing protein
MPSSSSLTLSSLTFSAGRALSAVAVVLFLWPGGARGQKVDRGKLDAAARRSGKAAKVLEELAALPPAESIPKELIERARAVAVFPDVDKDNLLFMKVMRGYGLMARRVPGGWGTPAFYGFALSDRGWTRVKSDNPGVVMLFMDDRIVKKFEKDGIKLEAEAGPVGELTAEKEERIRGAGILMYALSEGKVSGVSVEDDDTTQTGMNSDNNVNKAVYGLKAREVLWGKTPEGMTIPPAVAEFQNALARLSKQ